MLSARKNGKTFLERGKEIEDEEKRKREIDEKKMIESLI